MSDHPTPVPHLPHQPYLLTDGEHDAVYQAGQLWGTLCAVVEDGPTRTADLDELRAHVHAIQHAVMAQAAARAYPTLYRPLGGTLQESTHD